MVYLYLIHAQILRERILYIPSAISCLVNPTDADAGICLLDFGDAAAQTAIRRGYCSFRFEQEASIW